MWWLVQIKSQFGFHTQVYNQSDETVIEFSNQAPSSPNQYVFQWNFPQGRFLKYLCCKNKTVTMNFFCLTATTAPGPRKPECWERPSENDTTTHRSNRTWQCPRRASGLELVFSIFSPDYGQKPPIGRLLSPTTTLLLNCEGSKKNVKTFQSFRQWIKPEPMIQFQLRALINGEVWVIFGRRVLWIFFLSLLFTLFWICQFNDCCHFGCFFEALLFWELTWLANIGIKIFNLWLI